jgi:poly(3-hydroxybutyrate) depolymerase
MVVARIGAACAFAFACCLVLGAARAQETPSMDEQQRSGFFARTVVVGGVERRYALFVPHGYSPKRRPAPLLVFLNGMGECGTDGWKQTEVGLGAAIRADEARWPFLVAFPQKPDRESQWSEHGGLVLGVVRDVEATYYVDGKRRFLTGISQGGAGTWALGARHADVFAAIAPVCGYGKPDEVAAALKNTPIWAFHGEDDKVVPAQQSKALCAAVEATGGAPVLTLYANTAHNSWDQAYRESALAEWLRALPEHPWFATALARPQASALLNLSIAFGRNNADRSEQPTERVALGTSDQPDWRLTLAGRTEGKTATFGDSVPANRAAPSLRDAVRILVRAGVLEHDEPRSKGFDGAWVEVDYGFGYGGRSGSDWPKRWPVDDSTTAIVAEIRRAAEALARCR